MYDLLAQYGEDHEGSYHIPSNYVTETPDGEKVKLGRWLINQQYNLRNNRLSDQRQSRLQELLDPEEMFWSRYK